MAVSSTADAMLMLLIALKLAIEVTAADDDNNNKNPINNQISQVVSLGLNKNLSQKVEFETLHGGNTRIWNFAWWKYDIHVVRFAVKPCKDSI